MAEPTLMFAASDPACELPEIESTLGRHALADCVIPEIPGMIDECPDLTLDITPPTGDDASVRFAISTGTGFTAASLVDGRVRLGEGTARFLEITPGDDPDLGDAEDVDAFNRGAIIPPGAAIQLVKQDGRWVVLGSPQIWPLLALTMTSIGARDSTLATLGTAMLLTVGTDGSVRSPNGHRLALAGNWTASTLYERIPDDDPDTGEPMDESDPSTTYTYKQVNASDAPPVPTTTLMSHHGVHIPRFSFVTATAIGRSLWIDAPPQRAPLHAYTKTTIGAMAAGSKQMGSGDAVILIAENGEYDRKGSPFTGPIQIIGVDPSTPGQPSLSVDPSRLTIYQNTQGAILADTYVMLELIGEDWCVIEGSCKRATTGTPLF